MLFFRRAAPSAAAVWPISLSSCETTVEVRAVRLRPRRTCRVPPPADLVLATGGGGPDVQRGAEGVASVPRIEMDVLTLPPPPLQLLVGGGGVAAARDAVTSVGAAAPAVIAIVPRPGSQAERGPLVPISKAAAADGRHCPGRSPGCCSALAADAFPAPAARRLPQAVPLANKRNPGLLWPQHHRRHCLLERLADAACPLQVPMLIWGQLPAAGR